MTANTWHKVHGLEGKTLYTINNHPFIITEVTEDKVCYDPIDGTENTHWSSREAIEYLAAQNVVKENWSRILVEDILKESRFWTQEQQCTSYIYIILCEIGIAERRDMRKTPRKRPVG
jgi:hypothetical protein